MKIICPRCSSENSNGKRKWGSRCGDCNYYFSPEDIEIKIEWRKDIEKTREVQIGSWSAGFADEDFWGHNSSEGSFWGHNV